MTLRLSGVLVLTVLAAAPCVAQVTAQAHGLEKLVAVVDCRSEYG